MPPRLLKSFETQSKIDQNWYVRVVRIQIWNKITETMSNIQPENKDIEITHRKRDRPNSVSEEPRNPFYSTFSKTILLAFQLENTILREKIAFHLRFKTNRFHGTQ